MHSKTPRNFIDLFLKRIANHFRLEKCVPVARVPPSARVCLCCTIADVSDMVPTPAFC